MAVTKWQQTWTKFSWQDETWAKFSTLDVSVCLYTKQIIHCNKAALLEVENSAQKTLLYLPLVIALS